MNRTELLIEIDQKIKNSLRAIETEISDNAALNGLKSGDSYNYGKISFMKTAQFMWAISANNTFPKTDKFRHNFTKFLSNSIEDPKYSKHWDRTFNKIFSLLALTHQHLDVFSSEYMFLIESLLNSQNEDGFWAYSTNGVKSVRATAFVVNALTVASNYAGNKGHPFNKLNAAIESGINWLFENCSPKGTWGKKTKFSSDIYNKGKFESGIEVTSWCVYSICSYLNSNKNYTITKEQKRLLANSVNWLITSDINEIASTSEVEIEDYYFGKTLKKHEYQTTGIATPIIATIEYQISTFEGKTISLRKNNTFINKAILRLFKDEKNGYWLDKNSGDYKHLWTICYALVALERLKDYFAQERSISVNYFKILQYRITSRFQTIIKNKVLLILVLIGLLFISASIVGRYVPNIFFENYKNIFLVFGLLLSIIGLLKK